MKKIVSILLTIALVITTMSVSGVKANAETGEWQNTAIIAPVEGNLVGAGYIDIKYNTTLEGATDYKVYFDGIEKTEGYTKLDENTSKCEVYTTQVSAHTAKVVATTASGEIASDTITFYVSKKGLAMGGDMSETVEMKKLNISWYYNWGTAAFNSLVDDGVAHVPMVWGTEEENISEIPNITDDSNYILGYNEPDIESQANITPEVGLQYWPLIEATGKRTVSPVASNPNGPSSWVSTFLESADCDAVALHCYGGIIDVNRLLKAVDSMWEAYHKPIWVTEVSIMGRKGTPFDFSYENKEAREKMAVYVKQMVEELDKRDYVERYAWFPYNIQSANEIDGNDGCGATAMFDYENGKFTYLGKLYSEIGNPQGYNAYQMTEEDKYIYVAPTTPAADTTTSEITKLTETTTAPIAAVTTEIPKTITEKPAKVKVSQAKNSKKKAVTLKWSKASNAKKYQVQYSLNKKFNKSKKYKTKTVTITKFQYTVKKLTKKKTYYFRVRGVNGKEFGAWSKVKKVKIKK